jgi:hypothetical protein
MRAAGRAALSLALATALLGGGCGGDDDSPVRTTPNGSFDLEAEFDEQLPPGLKTGSPVRIAGVNVGAVTKVTRSAAGGVVAMRIRELPPIDAPPTIWLVHTDAQVRVYPRIFQKGAWFIDLRPGTANSQPLPNGDRLPADQTRTPSAPLP